MVSLLTPSTGQTTFTHKCWASVVLYCKCKSKLSTLNCAFICISTITGKEHEWCQIFLIYTLQHVLWRFTKNMVMDAAQCVKEHYFAKYPSPFYMTQKLYTALDTNLSTVAASLQPKTDVGVINKFLLIKLIK